MCKIDKSFLDGYDAGLDGEGGEANPYAGEDEYKAKRWEEGRQYALEQLSATDA